MSEVFSRGQIQDAICYWRDGETFDAIHPLADLPDEQTAILWDDNAMKDLARVIFARINGRTPKKLSMPWSHERRP